MLIFLVLLSALILDVASVILSYGCKEKSWLLLGNLAVGNLITLTWWALIKLEKDPTRFYYFACIWDFIATVVWLFLPLMLFDKIEVGRVGWLGLGFILVGLGLLKYALKP